MIKNRWLRALDYGKTLLWFYGLKPAAAIVRRAVPAYRGLWLVMERGNDARDNGYWFYRYLREQHPEINARYVITPDSADLDRITALGEPVMRGSFRHKLMYLCADRLVGTHVHPAAPDPILFYHLTQHGIRARGKTVLLKHGIIKDEMQWHNYPLLRVSLYACAAKPEYDFIHDTFGHPEGVVRYLGLCRFDHLLTAPAPRREILLMPTWRGSHYPSGDAFPQTAFYQHYQKLLNDPALHALLERAGCQLIFYPHVELQKELAHFSVSSPRVTLADVHSHDVQDLLMRCAVLITDYSSVYFDVAYLHKPVLYDQFDEEEFRSFHYQKGYFDYDRDGFGPVCRTPEALLAALDACARRDFRMEEQYLRRAQAFFPLRDTHNCERTFDAILSLS